MLSRKALQRVFFVASFIVCGLQLPAGEKGIDRVSLIKDVQVEGLTRTKLSVLEPIYEDCIGKPADSFRSEELVQKLRRIGLFHSIDVATETLEDGDVLVRIKLAEKWTLIPLPLAMVDGEGNFMAGLMFMESNLFGYNKKLMGGGMFSSDNWMGMLMYQDPGFLGSDYSLSLGFSGGYADVENRYFDGGTYQNFQTRGISLRSGIGRRILEPLTLELGALLREDDVAKNYNEALTTPDSLRLFAPSLSLRWQDLFFDRVFSYGFSAQAQYAQYFHLDGSDDPFPSFTASARGDIPLLRRLRLTLSAFSLYAPDSPELIETPADRYFNGVSREVKLDSALGGSVALEGIVKEFGWGGITVSCSYEEGIFSREGRSPDHTRGISGGIKLYLAKVVFPAIGCVWTYNPVTDAILFKMNIGFQM